MYVALSVLSLLRPRLDYITSSLIAGTHGAKAAVKLNVANYKKGCEKTGILYDYCS